MGPVVSQAVVATATVADEARLNAANVLNLYIGPSSAKGTNANETATLSGRPTNATIFLAFERGRMFHNLQTTRKNAASLDVMLRQY